MKCNVMKKNILALTVLLLSVFWSGTASAYFWTKAWHQIKRAVPVVTHQIATSTDIQMIGYGGNYVGTQVADEAKKAYVYVKEHGREICEVAVPTLLSQVVNKGCKNAAAEAAAACMGSIGPEMTAIGPEGTAMAAAACGPMAGFLYQA
jgi:hypothetical protein